MTSIFQGLKAMKEYWDDRTQSLVHTPVQGSSSFSVENFDPVRARFYMQILANLDQYKKIIKEYDSGSTIRNTFNEAITELAADKSFIDSENTAMKNKILMNVNKKLKINPLTNKKFEFQTGGEDSFFKEIKDRYDNAPNEAAPGTQTKEDIINLVDNHPIYSSKFDKTTYMDFATFIITTYIFRCLSLFLVDWAVSSEMVSTAHEGFMLYLGIYFILFGVLCLLVNTGSDSESLNPFKLIFYYINTDVNSTSRIFIHLMLQLLLVPIMFIAKENNQGGSSDQTTFEIRQSVMSTLNNLTFLIWVITSIVSTRL
jgi:hypothetical protein